jgi:Flp pilus assembly protein TadG
MLILILYNALSFDFSCAAAVRARLRTATDAAALAATMTAVLVPDRWKMVDAQGNPIDDPADAAMLVAIHWHPEIKDTGAARAAADTSFMMNGFSTEQYGLGRDFGLKGSKKMIVVNKTVLTENVEGRVCTSDYARTASPPYENDAYEYSARVLVKPVFLNGDIASILGGTVSVDETHYIPVSVVGTASAVVP